MCHLIFHWPQMYAQIMWQGPFAKKKTFFALHICRIGKYN